MRFNITDNVIVRALSKICDMVCLNILWLVCCIPVITIGASTTALYSVMMKLVKNEEGYIIKGFFGAFKSNFKQSTIVWIMILLLGFLWNVDFRVAGMMGGTAGKVLTVVLLAAGFIFLSMAIYVFPLIARYENTIRDTMRNAFILTVGRLPYSLLMVLVVVLAVMASFWNTVMFMFALPLWFLIGGSLIAWINSYILRRVFLIFEDSDNKTEKEGK